MKPDWKDAPEWANWLAMDEDGLWHWYEEEPVELDCEWTTVSGRIQKAGEDQEWEETKQKRP